MLIKNNNKTISTELGKLYIFLQDLEAYYIKPSQCQLLDRIVG